MLEKVLLIVTIISSVLSLGLIGLLRSVIKELQDVVKRYKLAKADGNISDQETNEIAKETIEAVEAIIKLGVAIKKAFGIVKKKIKK